MLNLFELLMGVQRATALFSTANHWGMSAYLSSYTLMLQALTLLWKATGPIGNMGQSNPATRSCCMTSVQQMRNKTLEISQCLFTVQFFHSNVWIVKCLPWNKVLFRPIVTSAVFFFLFCCVAKNRNVIFFVEALLFNFLTYISESDLLLYGTFWCWVITICHHKMAQFNKCFTSCP